MFIIILNINHERFCMGSMNLGIFEYVKKIKNEQNIEDMISTL